LFKEKTKLPLHLRSPTQTKFRMPQKTPTHKGMLLIAEPFLDDANFERSIVLLCEHNREGAFGFILNKPTNFQVQEVIDDIVYEDIPLYLGGPVEQNTLHFIHRVGDKIDGAVKISEGIYWGGNYEQVCQLINSGLIKTTDIRFFLGYSGWSAGQLEQEMQENTWITNEANVELLFETPPQELWRTILKNMGGKYKVMSNYPIDPRLN
jgi:putative transcriptional regulator